MTKAVQIKHNTKLLATLLFVLTVTSVMAQQQEFSNIVPRFEQYAKHSSGEKVFVHTDKENYLAGEITWFRLFAVDAGSLKPSHYSKVGYVELIDRSNKPVLQAKIEISDKGGAGSFYLPVTLQSDYYLLRAYTGTMKNNAAEFFEKKIAVVNTMKAADPVSVPSAKRVTLHFFPESGNLVAGIKTRLAFHIVDEFGKGVDANGVIVGENEDTITAFSTGKFGMGSVELTPVSNSSVYRATATLQDGTVISNVLPRAYVNGFVMNVMDNKDGRLQVRVQARGRDNTKRGENVYLVAHARQQIRIAETGYVNYENELVFYIDKTKLPAGVTYFTVFNAEQRPVCERLVFIPPALQANLAVSTDKNVYQVRQPVAISVGSDTATDPARGDYSLSVYRIDSLTEPATQDLVSYLFLSSDLAGEVESPGYYLSGNADDAAIDHLMLTHGWRRFKWENVLSTANASVSRAPGSRGHVITAKVLNAADQKPAADVDCYLSHPGSPFGFYGAKTDSNGVVRFDISGYYGPGEIIIQAGRDTVSRYRVDVLTPFAETKSSTELPLLKILKEDEELITARSIAMQAQNIYLADSMGKFNPPAISDTFPFYGVPEYTYRLDDYKRFTTMEEVLREYVRPVNVVARNGSLYMRVFDELYFGLYSDGAQSVYGDNTLVLLDGVAIMNYNKMFTYDPLKIKKLDVIPRRFMFGGNNFKGILSFESYHGKFDGFEFTPGVVSVDYEGLQLQREFYSPAYSTPEQRAKRVPDFRSTLLWVPALHSAAKGKTSLQFHTSDLAGRYLVLVQGFDGHGTPVSGATSFVVEQ